MKYWIRRGIWSSFRRYTRKNLNCWRYPSIEILLGGWSISDINIGVNKKYPNQGAVSFYTPTSPLALTAWCYNLSILTKSSSSSSFSLISQQIWGWNESPPLSCHLVLVLSHKSIFLHQTKPTHLNEVEEWIWLWLFASSSLFNSMPTIGRVFPLTKIFTHVRRAVPLPRLRWSGTLLYPVGFGMRIMQAVVSHLTSIDATTTSSLLVLWYW